MLGDEDKMEKAYELALKADAERKSSDESDSGGMHCIEVPQQKLWLFSKKAALRALEAMKTIGLHGRFVSKEIIR